MMKTSSSFVKTCKSVILALLTLLLLISTTGCSKRLVVVPGGQTVTVSKQELDQCYQDRELLLQALEQCKNKGK